MTQVLRAIGLCLAGMVLAQLAAAEPLMLYVSPAGNDAATGRAPQATAGKPDGPFATVARARDEVRKLRAAGKLAANQPVNVLLRGGIYRLEAPIEFSAEDSGSAQAPVTYTAYQDEKPILSGGVVITGWKEVNGRWVATLPEVAKGEWAFLQLWVNDQRRFRPRLPKKGYYYIANEVAPTAKTGGHGYDRFVFNPGEIDKSWVGSDADVLCFSHWFVSRLRIEDVDVQRNVVTFTGSTRTSAAHGKLPRGWRYLVENVPQALSDPGEFYLDRKAGTLTYIPMPGETLGKTEIVAPRLEKILVFKGEPDKGKGVHHVQFVGLTIAHTNYFTPQTGYSSPQAEMPLPGTISAEALRDCVFKDCTITHTAAHAIELGAGCKRVQVVDCRLTDLGAGGVKIGVPSAKLFDPKRKAAENENVASDNVVRGCLIAQGGRVHPAGIGVLILQSPGNLVEQNRIYDFYYTGVSVGWTWGYKDALAQDNVIQDNLIHHIGQAVLSDMGGIYTLGNLEGSVCRRNRISDVYAYTYGGWGLYTDEGSTHLVMEENVVDNTKTGGFHQHYGQENQIRNNIFVNGIENQLQRSRAEDHLSFTFEHNILAWKEGILLKARWKDMEHFKLDYNVYWPGSSGEAAAVNFDGKSLAEWQKAGQDVHSVVADPQFVDAAHGDYSLKPTSPALKLGFKPIDLSRVPKAEKWKLDEVAPAFPTMTAEPVLPPLPIAEDFEETPVGAMITGAMTNEDKAVKRATARVTDETAAGGSKHSLKFVEAPGQEKGWTPHVYYNTTWTEGVIVGSFDLRVENGAVVSFEWRTEGHPYKVGPSIQVSNGWLNVKGKGLIQLPKGQWVHLEMTAGVGTKANGKWDLAVTLPGAAPRQFGGLPCESGFTALRWLGFSSPAKQDAVYYVDNIVVRPKQ